MAGGEEEGKAPELCKIMFGDEAEAGWATAGERMRSWARAFEGWLEEQERQYSTKRRMEDRHAWKDFWTCRGKLPWEVGEQEVLAWVEQLRLRGLGAKTIHRRLFALEGFYQYCQGRGVDPELGPSFNPLRGVKRPSVKYLDRPDYLTLEETQALLRAVDRETSLAGKRDYAVILTALRTGREIGEILKMRFKDAPGGDVGEAIEGYLRAAGRWEGMKAGEYIFAPLVDPLGDPPTGKAEEWDGSRPICGDHARFVLGRYASWAGLDPVRVTWRCLRHTAAAIRLEMGEDAERISESLGRRSRVGTRRYLRELGRTAGYAPAMGPSVESGGAGERKTGRWGEERVRYGRRRMKMKAEVGNTLRLKHGLYSKKKPEEILQALVAEQKVIGGEVVGLKAEVLGLRILLGQLFGQALEKASNTDELLKVLDGFGKGSVRLSALLRAEKELDGGQSELMKIIDQALSETVAELKAGKGP